MIVRTSGGLAAAFACLGGEENGQVRSGPWNDVCHQGRVHDGSFPALFAAAGQIGVSHR
ncbi:hypothetical protein OHB05_43090 [Streptomyces sp. NBC_00638]|uniref:hypothetical protein n=1 Tax=unclassified Streptomyces TaxID=2593676 RepID=UPI002253F7E9|nr:hypothetical protein [Streptomyces sp. NBC_00638]MCX5009300.1 hypothetical protein [Streptomyces sp. NBC_00638]